MDIFLQALLVAIFVTVAFIDSHTLQTHIFRPIVVGPIVGLIMGDVETGFNVGISIELMFLAVIFVGTATPPDPTISTAIATAIAILGGGSTELAIATALPISFIGQIATTFQNSIINVWFMHRVDKEVEEVDVRGIIRNNTIYPLLLDVILYGVPTFLAVYYGADFVSKVIEIIPEKMITGLAVGGGMIGAVGFALLLTTIKTKKMWPFFLIGFFFASYLNINMIGIAVLTISICGLYYYNYEK